MVRGSGGVGLGMGVVGEGGKVMSPEQIQHLVRMAEEIEALEREAGEDSDVLAPIPFPAALRARAGTRHVGLVAGEPPAFAAASGARGKRPMRVFGWLAAAACMGLAVGVAWRASTPAVTPVTVESLAIASNNDEPSTPIVPEIPSATIPEVPEETPSVAIRTVADAGPAPVHYDNACESAGAGMASMVFAIARDMETDCGDRQHVIRKFAPGPLGSMSRAELLRLGYEASGFSTPDRILVVSVSGPVEELPHTQAEAEALIACMDLSKTDPETSQLVGALGHDEAKYAAAARSCLSDGVLVEAATLMGR